MKDDYRLQKTARQKALSGSLRMSNTDRCISILTEHSLSKDDRVFLLNKNGFRDIDDIFLESIESNSGDMFLKIVPHSKIRNITDDAEDKPKQNDSLFKPDHNQNEQNSSITTGDRDSLADDETYPKLYEVDDGNKTIQNETFPSQSVPSTCLKITDGGTSTIAPELLCESEVNTSRNDGAWKRQMPREVGKVDSQDDEDDDVKKAGTSHRSCNDALPPPDCDDTCLYQSDEPVCYGCNKQHPDNNKGYCSTRLSWETHPQAVNLWLQEFARGRQIAKICPGNAGGVFKLSHLNTNIIVPKGTVDAKTELIIVKSSNIKDYPSDASGLMCSNVFHFYPHGIRLQKRLVVTIPLINREILHRESQGLRLLYSDTDHNGKPRWQEVNQGSCHNAPMYSFSADTCYLQLNHFCMYCVVKATYHLPSHSNIPLLASLYGGYSQSTGVFQFVTTIQLDSEHPPLPMVKQFIFIFDHISV